jgi:hypothetical protein
LGRGNLPSLTARPDEGRAAAIRPRRQRFPLQTAHFKQ